MLLALICVLMLVCEAFAQEVTPSPSPGPSPTPTEINVRTAKLPELDSLKKVGMKSFESSDGRFRINLPQKYLRYRPSQIFSQNSTPRFGTIEWDLQEASIVIQFAMLPPGTATGATELERERIMASILDGGIHDAAAERAYEKNLTQGNLPARELKAAVNGRNMITRVILSGDDYYVLGATLHQAPDAEALVRKAFDSFSPVK